MENRHVSEKVLVTAMVASMALWGLSWPAGKVLTHYCSPVNMSAYRYLIVFVFLLPCLLFFKVSFKVKKEGIPAILASGAMLAAYSYFMFRGLKKGSAGAGGILVTTLNPIFAYILSVVFSRRMPSRNAIIGLILAVAAGCILLKVWSNMATIFESGNLYFLLAAFLWAAMSKITAIGANYGSSLGFSLWQYLATGLFLIPFMDMNEFRGMFLIRDALFWGNLFFCSVIVTLVATTVYFYSTTRLGAAKASSYIFMVPMMAGLSAWLLLGERIQPHTAIGGALGILAVYAINKKTTLG